MKKMLVLKVAVTVVIIAFSIVMALEVKENIEYKDVKMPKGEIILVERSFNFAFGYYFHNGGVFIDSEGDVYQFNFEKEQKQYYEVDQEFIDELKEVRKTEEPFCKVSKETVKKIYANGMKIDKNAKVKEIHNSCDAGVDSVYFYNASTGDIIEFYAYGDVIRKLDDKHAEEAVNIYKDRLDRISELEREKNLIETFVDRVKEFVFKIKSKLYIF